jgi:hypothetical protein
LRAKRRDANHQEVGDFLRDLGWSVLDLADAGDGVPDYAVSKLIQGVPWAALVEVKDGAKPKSARALTPKEQKVKDGWQGPYIVALSGEDAAVKLVMAWRGECSS